MGFQERLITLETFSLKKILFDTYKFVTTSQKKDNYTKDYYTAREFLEFFVHKSMSSTVEKEESTVRNANIKEIVQNKYCP